MKNLIMTLAVFAFAVTIVSAQTVSSANIVGYSKVLKPAAGLQLLGISFGADSTLDDLVSINQFTGDTVYVKADRVITWNTAITNYVTYGLYSTVPHGGSLTEWRNAAAWTTAGSVNPIVPAGSGVWLDSPNTTVGVDLIISGEVLLSQYTTNSIVTGLQIMASPYSSDATLSDLQLIESGAYGDAVYAKADKITTWSTATTNYVTYGLYSMVPYGGSLTEWRNGSAWMVPGAVNDTIELGKGFWYTASTNINWVMENPYFNNL